MAIALLLSITLAFGVAAAQWSLARAADVQEVADATALAGENCVAAFSTVAQVIDACVVTMGIAGIAVCGAGLVVAAIPGLQAKAPAIVNVGRKVLEARRNFARSAASGLERLEQALPALIMANSASCASANSQGGISYVGMAVPFPQTSQSDFSSLQDEVESEEMEEHADELREASERKDAAHKRAEEAKERAWRADNVDNPMCIWSRVDTLTGLGGSLNPHYASHETWEFEYARVRVRNYYGCRWANERVGGETADELQRSCARKQFYGYAYEQLGRMSCTDTETEVDMRLELVPHTTDMVKVTRLYTDAVWPCTDEEGVRVLHCSLACPAALGGYWGNASLSAIDTGGASRCPTCRMDAQAMGNVADASTNISNGLEHYWRIVVEASEDYEAARRDEIEAEREMREAAEQGRDAFDEAMEELEADRPRLCPPGAWGCVSVVSRPRATAVPTELTRAFLSGSELPAGAAVSAAVLAPDEATRGNTILSRAFDGLRTDGGSLALDLVGSITGFWSNLLLGYGSAYEGALSATNRFLEGVEGIAGQEVASWLRSRLEQVVNGVDLAPADLRLRKPVLVNSQTVLDRAGMTTVGEARSVLQQLPTSPQELVALLRQKVIEQLGTQQFTVAELPIPGLEGVTIPLTIDLSKVGAQ